MLTVRSRIAEGSGVAGRSSTIHGHKLKNIKFCTLKIDILNIIVCSIAVSRMAFMTDLLEWQALASLAGDQSFTIERVRLASGVVIEGRFVPPDLAKLSVEDQVFVAAFVRAHGSIKEMERFFGVSYPTIKARLNRISAALSFVETEAPPDRSEILARLGRGEITVSDAIAQLEALK